MPAYGDRQLCYIIPVDPGAHPEHPIVYPPRPGGGGEGIWGPDDPRPQPPIVLPIPPDAIAPGVPAHPIYLPIYPSHPIYIPPGSLAPGVPTHPIVIPPPRPAHPIEIPPGAISPGVPAHPIVLPPPIIWGPPGPWPTPPIVIPPNPQPQPPTEAAPAGFGWAFAYVPVIASWLYVAVAEEELPHVEPHTTQK